MEGPGRSVLLATADPVVLRALERTTGTAGLELTSDASAEPAAVVVDLDRPDALQTVSALRTQFPGAFIAGHTGRPSRDLWLEAERAGCDAVTNRGAVANVLLRRLPPVGHPRRRRLAMVESADLPGRIGLVQRLPDTPVGPVALYQLRGTLCAVQDSCPHAGATVSMGEIEQGVVTCPGHGSRFDVCTGERVRGPADSGLRIFELVEEDGFVYLLWRPGEDS